MNSEHKAPEIHLRRDFPVLERKTQPARHPAKSKTLTCLRARVVSVGSKSVNMERILPRTPAQLWLHTRPGVLERPARRPSILRSPINAADASAH